VSDPKPHLSNTQCEMYWKCGEQYRRRYMEGERLPPGVAMMTGSGVHGGAEINFRQKIDSRKDIPRKDIVDAAVAAFDAAGSNGYALTDDEAGRGAKAVLGEARDQTAALAELHAKEQAPDYQPVAVECQSRIVFPNASRDLLAITDLRDNRNRIIDIKTAGKRMAQSDVDHSFQLTIYAAAYQLDYGVPPDEVRFDVLTKTKIPQRQVVRSQRTQADFQVLINRVNATTAGIDAGLFMPASPGAWWCSQKWCGFARTCPYFNPERI